MPFFLNFGPFSNSTNLISSRIRRDENDIPAVVDVLTNVFIHPFSEMTLASISTGIIVNENAAERMLEGKINGINEMGKFISDRLQPGKRLSFFDPFKRNNTMTFDTIKKKKKPCKIKTKVMSNESSIFFQKYISIFPLGAASWHFCANLMQIFHL